MSITLAVPAPPGPAWALQPDPRWPPKASADSGTRVLDVAAVAGGLTITSAVLSASPAGLGLAALAVSGTTVSVQFVAGTQDTDYIISYSLQLSDGSALTIDTRLYVDATGAVATTALQPTVGAWPTAPDGLPVGSLWRDGDILRVVVVP